MVLLMMMAPFISSDVVHVFTLGLDPLVDTVKRSAVGVGSGTIVVVVDTLECVESSSSVGLRSILLSLGSISGVLSFSALLVLNGLFGGLSDFTGFLFLFLNGIVIILSGSVLSKTERIIGVLHGLGPLIHSSFGHNFSNWSSLWLWKNDLLIDTVESATLDEFNMSIRGMVETVDVSTGVGNSGLVSCFSLLSEVFVFSLVIGLMSEGSSNIN